MFQELFLLVVLVSLPAIMIWLLRGSNDGPSRRNTWLQLETLEERITPSSVQSYDLFDKVQSSNPAQFADGGNGDAYFIARTDVEMFHFSRQPTADK